MKNKYLILITLLVICITLISGCAKADDKKVQPTATTKANNNVDDDYTLEIVIGEESVKVTKKQIKELASSGKEVSATDDKPVYASDKTDDDGNKIPHTLKGVYLDDILDVYANGKKTEDFAGMTLFAIDGYETVLTEEVYNTNKGGSKMIIAYEYDGVVLNPDEKSGALRVVLPDQTANSWAKQLSKIELLSNVVVLPETEQIYFAEGLGENYEGSYEFKQEVDGVEKEYINYGLSFKKLFDAGLLTADEKQDMFVYAWDGEEYTSTKTYEYYIDAFFVYGTKEKSDNGEITAVEKSPVFNGSNIKKGMKVKNTLYANTNKKSLVALNTAFAKLDTDDNKEIALKDLLKAVNMKESASEYAVTDLDGKETTISGEDIKNATIKLEEDGYYFISGSNKIIISGLKIK